MSSRLHYNELSEEKKLGEGSFGIVYLGTYRNNKVAIKKLKKCDNSKDSMIEFEKEVAMMDKFRNDYIIHFYGACFIPNKICMVTEFAPYGSINDLMKKQPNGISSHMKLKIMLDAAHGIEYLHDNGILHRDIKPDNFLVISLEKGMKVNAKLTDFGSSRNINLLMTNLTFTKGIGTPKYMAPEVLNREHYKKPTDIYSFAITMYEVFSWSEAYPKQNFRFAWDIAEFVGNGKRLQKSKLMTDFHYNLINQSWCQNPKERLRIEDIVSLLETQFLY